MSLDADSHPPLPEWVTDAYTVLSNHMTDAETGNSQGQLSAIDREKAVDVLCASDELVIEPEDARYGITRLLNRGYFYEVGDELRITIPPE